MDKKTKYKLRRFKLTRILLWAIDYCILPDGEPSVLTNILVAQDSVNKRIKEIEGVNTVGSADLVQ